MDLVHLRTLIFECPLAINPAKFDVIIGAIGHRLNVEATLDQLEAAAKPFKAKQSDYRIEDGIAIIPVTGTLMRKTSGLMAASGCTSYESLGGQFKDAMSNPAIKGVLLDIDSPGGSTQGLFELCEFLSSDHDKPVFACANDGALSAAYAIASCADKIYLTRTAAVGSIGVFVAHLDQSGADAQAGLKYTFVHAGSRKVDGNSHEPLSSTAQADIKAEVDRQYQFFVSLVAKNRNATEDEVKSTEAGVYFGENAVPLLADKVGTLADALSDLANGVLNTNDQMPKGVHGTKLNNSGQDKAVSTPSLKSEDTKTMTQNDELNIDELITAHAEKACDRASTDDKEEEAKKASDGDGDEEEDEKKKAKSKAKAKKDDEEEDGKDGKDGDEEEDGKPNARAEAVRIVNLCALANMPELAGDFLAAGYTVTQVEKALLKHRAEKSKTVKIASSNAKPVAGFRNVAAELMNNKTAANKAEEYKRYLVEHSNEYLQAMSNREFGENYKFAPKRGF
jgi:signal peptide peptidase SppA